MLKGLYIVRDGYPRMSVLAKRRLHLVSASAVKKQNDQLSQEFHHYHVDKVTPDLYHNREGEIMKSTIQNNIAKSRDPYKLTRQRCTTTHHILCTRETKLKTHKGMTKKGSRKS